MDKITVGIPKALLFYYYQELWLSFFEKLGVDVILSEDTTKETIAKGEQKSIDEACLALKIYLGHIENLRGRCHYILVPRMYCIKKNEQVCTNFNCLYDLVHNLYPNVFLLSYNIDLEKKKTEAKAFVHLGEQLGFSYIKSYNAYLYAKEKERLKKKEDVLKQEKNLYSPKLKVLLASHPYNLYDSYICSGIVRYLTKEGVEIFYSDKILPDFIDSESKKISSDVHWSHSKEELAGIHYYADKVDGIILLSSFPCGPDSLTSEMIKRNISIPILYLVFENEFSDGGILTRLESFCDILRAKKEDIYERNH